MDLSTKAPPELDYYSLQVGISGVSYEVLELVYVLVQGTSLLIIGRQFQTADSQGVGVGRRELRFEGGGEILPV